MHFGDALATVAIVFVRTGRFRSSFMNNRTNLWRVLILFSLAFLIYGFGLGREFVFDDIPYISENPLLRRADAFHLFWFSSEAVNYYPVFWSLLRVQWLLWGDHTTGYQLVNLILHSLNAVLVWRVVKAWRLPGAWWAGCLFAVHPINVQTVAWAAEQKNTWSFLFMALALLAFIKHSENNDWQSYTASLVCFLAALGCKPSVVALPVFLAICQGSRQGKIAWRSLIKLIPFFLGALSAGVIALWFEKNRVGACSQIMHLGLWQRSEVAAADLWFYLGKALLPVGLTPMYHGWSDAAAAGFNMVPLMFLLATVTGCALFWKRIGAPLVLGLCYYAVMLLPLLGVFDTNYFQYSLIADHWQYHALPGIIVAVLAAGNRLLKRFGSLPPMAANWGGALAVLGVAMLASLHFSRFEDARTLWSFVVSRNPDAWVAWYNLGNCYADKHDYPNAITAYERSIEVKNGYYKSNFNLANTLAAAGRLPEADRAFLAADKIQDDDANLFNNRGVVLLRLGREDEALAAFARALHLEPGKPSAHTNLVCILLRRGRLKEAATHLQPSVTSGQTNCGRVAEAIKGASSNGVAPKEELIAFATRACELTGNRQGDLQSALKSLRGE